MINLDRTSGIITCFGKKDFSSEDTDQFWFQSNQRIYKIAGIRDLKGKVGQKATVILHNYIRPDSKSLYNPSAKRTILIHGIAIQLKILKE